MATGDYKLDASLSVVDNSKKHLQNVHEKADAIVTGIGPCVIELKKKWTDFEQALINWEDFAQVIWNGSPDKTTHIGLGNTKSTLGSETGTYYYYTFGGFTGEELVANGRITSDPGLKTNLIQNTALTDGVYPNEIYAGLEQGLDVWWNFTRYCAQRKELMSLWMSQMPDDVTLASLGTDTPPDLLNRAVGNINTLTFGGDIDYYLNIATGGTYASKGSAFFKSLAGQMLPNPKAYGGTKKSSVPSETAQTYPEQGHPGYWIGKENAFDSNYPDASKNGELYKHHRGGGGSKPFAKVTKAWLDSDWILEEMNKAITLNVGGDQYKRGSQWRWNPGWAGCLHIHSADYGLWASTGYDPTGTVTTDTTQAKNAIWSTEHSFWGKTFYHYATAAYPETFFWWNQDTWKGMGKLPPDGMAGVAISKDWTQTGGGSVTKIDKYHDAMRIDEYNGNARSNGQSYVSSRFAAQGSQEKPNESTMFGAGTAKWPTPRPAHADPPEQGGKKWDSMTPYSYLAKYYFELKKAAYEFRTAVACIVELNAELWAAQETAENFAEAVQDDPAFGPGSPEFIAAQELLDKLDEMENQGLAGLTSSFTKNLIFREQCFLLAKVFSLSAWKKDRDEQAKDSSSVKKAPYDPVFKTNSSLIVDDSTPYAFINRLTQDRSQKTLFDLNNWDISSLQPMIKLFKVNFSEALGKEVEVPVTFPSRTDISSLLKDKRKRGEGVGIQSFNFTYDGSNPFSAKKSIKAKLKIFANTFDELLKPRGFGSTSFRYVDLALKTSNTLTGKCANWGRKTDNEQLAKLNFRLKAVVGWAYPKHGKMAHFSEGVSDAVYNSYVTLNLTPTVHDFQIDEQGRVVLEINYLAYADDFFDQKEYDIFNNPEIITSQIARRLAYNNFKRTCDSTEVESLKRDEKEVIGEEKRQNVSTLLGRLIDSEKIYYITANTDDIKNFQSKGPFYDPGHSVMPLTDEERDAALTTSVAAALDKYTAANEDLYSFREELAVGLSVVNPNDFDLAFFYVSDLVDVILENLGAGLPLIAKNLEKFISRGAKAAKAAKGKKSTVAKPLDRPLQGHYYQSDLCEVQPSTCTKCGYAKSPVFKVNAWYIQDNNKDGGSNHPDNEIEINLSVPTCVSSTGQYDMYHPGDHFDPYTGPVSDYKARTEAATKAAIEAGIIPEGSSISLPAATRQRTFNASEMYDCDVEMQIFKYERLIAQYKKFRVMLGPIEIVDRKNDLRVATLNFADLPISVKYFIEFLTEKLSTKEESTYSLSNFLNDFFNNLVRNFLNDDTCFTHSINVSQKVRVTQAAVTSYKTSSETMDEIMTAKLKKQKSSVRTKIKKGSMAMSGRTSLQDIGNSVLRISGERNMPDGGEQGFDNEINYMIYFAGRTQPREMMRGNRSTDESSGIFHYLMGKDRGIVKNIQLSKTQTPGLQEVRFEQEGYDGLRQLRVVYDVNIDTYSNVKTFPGTYIYVDPRSFAPTTNDIPGDPMNLTEYGIGGYYMVIRSEHNFAPGDASSKIFAKWVNQLENDRVKDSSDKSQAAKNDLVGDASGCKRAYMEYSSKTP